jgi:hypothetical protein
MSAFADYHAAIAADIAIVKSSAEDEYCRAGLRGKSPRGRDRADDCPFGELNQRIDRLPDARE